jgi:hypothetical protein
MLHYNYNMHVSCEECSTRSFETKWSLMKHDISKFCGNYEVVVALNKSGVCNESVFRKDRGVSMFTWAAPSWLGECISWHIGRIFLFVNWKIWLKNFLCKDMFKNIIAKYVTFQEFLQK